MNRVRKLDRQINRVRERISELTSNLLLSGIRYDTPPARTSPRGLDDRFAAIENKLARLNDERRRLLLERADGIRQLSAMFETLDDDKERLALTAYYIAHKDVKETASMMGYDQSTVYGFMHKGREHLNQKRETARGAASLYP